MNKLSKIVFVFFILFSLTSMAKTKIDISEGYINGRDKTNKLMYLDDNRVTKQNWQEMYVTFYDNVLFENDIISFNGKERWVGDNVLIYLCPGTIPNCQRPGIGEIRVNDNVWKNYNITLIDDAGDSVYIKTNRDFRFDSVNAYVDSQEDDIAVQIYEPLKTNTKLIGDEFNLSCFATNSHNITILPIMKKNDNWITIPIVPTESLITNKEEVFCNSNNCNATFILTTNEKQTNQLFGCMALASGLSSKDYKEVDIIENINDFIIDNNDNYQYNTFITMNLYSSLSTSLHTFEVYESTGDLVCRENILSPPIPNTVFEGVCNLDNTLVQDNVYAVLYANEDNNYNITEYFDIVSKVQDSDYVNIKQVYYSPQVLQGSSTEIFAVIENNGTEPIVKITITFQDNSTRQLSMEPTSNDDEYRAYITDTFQVGITKFYIYAENNNYFDDYNNNYLVVEYSLDFVDVVNEVGEVFEVRKQTPTINVLGTYYEIGDTAKVIAQLSQSGVAVNNASCFTSIYHPDDSVHLRNTIMNYVENSDGLYTYDMVISDSYNNISSIGVWALSVVCDYETIEEDIMPYSNNVIFGQDITNNITNYFYDDNILGQLQTNNSGSNEVFEVEFFYNISDYNITNTSDLFLLWQGNTNIGSNDINIYWLHNNGSWLSAENVITNGLTDVSFKLPDSITDINNILNNSILKVKLNTSIPKSYGTVQFFNENFEDDSIVPFNCTVINGGLVCGTDEGGINGTNAYILGDGDSGIDDIGYLQTNINAIEYNNISLTYTRYVSGTESNEIHYVSVYSGERYINLTEDWETGNFDSQHNLWVDNDWYTSGTVDVDADSYSGSYAVRLRSNDGYIDRGIDFSDQNSSYDVIISFWAKARSFENNEYAYFMFENSSGSNDYTVLETWENGDDDNVWRYYEYNLSDYPNITLGSDNEIAFQADMSGSGDYFYMDDLKIQMFGDIEVVLESWYGNSAETTKTYNLDSSFDNNENISLKFYANVDYNNDYFGVDDISLFGTKRDSYDLFSDFLLIKFILPAGIVNEIRGGGEFNVKDRLADIEASLENIEDNLGISSSEKYSIIYTMPGVYSPNDSPLLSLYLHEVKNPSIGYAGADCTYTITGEANDTSSGATQMTEISMTDGGGGIYYAIPLNPYGDWNPGIYQIETNCDITGEGTFYNIDGFRMEENYVNYLTNINSSIVTINNINLTATEINLNTNETAVVMIGNTEYKSNEEGMVGIRLMKNHRNSQDVILNAICNLTILYPNSTTKFLDNVGMIEYGDGIYYKNFTTPETEGVYIYYSNCEKGNKDYYGMNTFHVSPWANQIYNMTVTVDLSNLESQLNEILVDVERLKQFTAEQIYLITDSMVQIKNLVNNDEINETEKQIKTLDVIYNLNNNGIYLDEKQLITQKVTIKEKNIYSYSVLYLILIPIFVVYVYRNKNKLKKRLNKNKLKIIEWVKENEK